MHECGRLYAPFMLGNAAAVAAGEDEVDCMLDGGAVRWRQNSFKYQAKCVGWLADDLDAYGKMPTDLLNNEGSKPKLKKVSPHDSSSALVLGWWTLMLFG